MPPINPYRETPMKRPAIRILLLLPLVLASACDETTDPDISAIFQAQLTGAAERPNPVTTVATGSATFELNEAEDELKYTLNVGSLTGATQSHIHFGSASVAGPIVVYLWGPVPSGQTITALTPIKSGTIRAVDVAATNATSTVPAFNGTFAKLIEEMRAGNMYVNVHSLANGPGEIRGQLVLQP